MTGFCYPSRVLDLKDWPLVRISYPEDVTDNDISVLATELKVVLDKGERFCMVIDAARTFSLTPKQRKMVVETIEGETLRMKKSCVAQAIVVKNSLARGVVTALLWLRDAPVPLKTFDDHPHAEAWLRERMK